MALLYPAVVPCSVILSLIAGDCFTGPTINSADLNDIGVAQFHHWLFLLEYYQWKYGKPLKPVQRRNGKTIPEDTICPLCGAPHHFIYDNNGGNGQYQCKVCGQTFSSGEVVTTPFRLTCPHCGNTLVAKKDRKFFRIHKCVKPFRNTPTSQSWT